MSANSIPGPLAVPWQETASLLDRPQPKTYDAINWALVERIRQLSVPEKNEIAFAAADFALRQKRLILAESHPDWTAEQVDQEARRLVYGTSVSLLLASKLSDYRPKIVRNRPKNKMVNPVTMIILNILTMLHCVIRPNPKSKI